MQDARKTQLEEMIKRTGQGDRDAFAALYEASSAKLHAMCISVLKDRPEAEEALEETYIKIWQSADRFASNGLSPMAWLLTVARNISVDKLRVRNAADADADVPIADSLTAITPKAAPAEAEPTADAATEGPKTLAESIDELAETQARALRAVYLEGVTYADLAKREDMALNTVRSWLRRSLLRLKDSVNQ